MKRSVIILLLTFSTAWSADEASAQSEQIFRGKKCKKFNSVTTNTLNVCNAACITNLHATNAAITNLAGVNAVFQNLDVNGLAIFPGTYAHAAINDMPQTINPNNDVIFNDTLFIGSSDVSIIPLTATTFSSILVPPGAYAFFFSIDGLDTIDNNTALLFGLFNHTLNQAVPTSLFHSNEVDGATTINNIARGFGIALFAMPTAISLRNFSPDPAMLTVYADGGINASLGLIRFGKP